MRSDEFLTENYDSEDDNFNNRKRTDVRRSRLTLKHLNKLRKQREIHKAENSIRAERVRKIYGMPQQ